MLTPEYLDTLPDTLVSLWQRVEDDILRDIARRIGKMDTVTETAAWQLWRLEQTRALHTDIVRLLARYSGKSDAEIRRLLQEAGTQTLASDDALYQAMGLEPSDVNTAPALLNLLNAGYRQTRGTWQNLTRTTANTVTLQFENALDRAWLQVSSGAFDYKAAIKRAVDELSQDMKHITYPTGHRDTLEVAVRRAVLTGVNQTACKLQIARADEMGCEFVEVSAHSGARSDGSRGPRDHAWWQGKVYHRGSAVEYNGERYESFEDATGYGTGEGLCGWNCRHNFHPFWPGISVPNYTPERLAELNARNIEYNGKMYTRYEIDQQQRALERRVRAAKRKHLAESAAGVDATQAAVQLKQARQKLKAFVQATGGRADSARESVSGFGRSQASKVAWANRKFTANAKDGIINSRGDGVGIDIEIDRFTPCLLDTETNELVETEYKLVTASELKGLKAKGWLFNWRGKDLSNSEIYKLTLQGDDKIQGLVAVEPREDNFAYHLSLVESAPENRLGRHYEGVGGHLFAIAAKKSLEAGYGGFIFFEAKNIELVNHYQTRFGATWIGRPHEYSMIIDEKAAQELLDNYTLNGGD